MPDLRRKQQILKENGVETGEQWLIKLHLAHEFYHFLEAQTAVLPEEHRVKYPSHTSKLFKEPALYLMGQD